VHRRRLRGELGVHRWSEPGTLSIRFQDIDLENYVAPTVSAHWIKLADLDTELPPGTKFLTPEERADARDARPASDKRYAPFVQI
jgi:hypothetical protein